MEAPSRRIGTVSLPPRFPLDRGFKSNSRAATDVVELLGNILADSAHLAATGAAGAVGS